ncbi:MULTISPECIES: hypothetical protein [Brevibacillus]|uniref:hypothetical protein n=1 Tax=Brevibacillus TaxID=55080 RepID=UPI0002EDE4CD|nr:MULTISPECIES: hypothetical protein [Brevibacillus]MBA4535235.1 hypothetical protein [Brevibacillus halotolerans]
MHKLLQIATDKQSVGRENSQHSVFFIGQRVPTHQQGSVGAEAVYLVKALFFTYGAK